MIVTHRTGTPSSYLSGAGASYASIAPQLATRAEMPAFYAAMGITPPPKPLVTTGASLEKQIADGREALKDYVNERKTWQQARVERRRTALKNIHVLYILQFFACRNHYHNRNTVVNTIKSANPTLWEVINKRSKTCPPIDKYTDTEIEFLASAVDVWETTASGSGPFNPDTSSGSWNPMSGKPGVALDTSGKPYMVTFSEVSTNPHSLAWTLLRDGVTPTTGFPVVTAAVSRPGDVDLATIVLNNGLSGLAWYAEAVPAVRLLARLRKGSPDWSVTQTWIEKLEPLTYSDVTQQDLDAETARYAYSNPMIRAGNMRIVAAAITDAVKDAINQTPDMPTPDTLASSPWLWVLLIGGVAAGGIWYYRSRKSGGGK